jgi:hypothetical protein
MSVLVRIGRKKAILCAGKWSCADTRVEEQLQAALEIWVQKTGGPPIGNPDPDKYAAEAIRHEMDFEVILANKPKSHKPQNAYLSKRQIRLPFF